MEIRVYVAAHKPYRMPRDPMYVPLHVGALGKPPLFDATDATGDNISQKNPHYCELTGLYWIWKNADADYLGLAHYRRHFSGRRLAADKWRRVMTRPEMEKALKRAEILLPKPRRYVIETNWSQYAHAHHEADLVATRECIAGLCPAYLPAFDAVMKRTSGHRFNMLVMRRDALDRYCSWLFPILFALEDRLDISGYSPYDARVFGFIGERLLDVWLEHTGAAYAQAPVVNMESQRWPTKILRFLQRKRRAARR